jgi:membrane fusion protein, multidrug efflux system
MRRKVIALVILALVAGGAWAIFNRTQLTTSAMALFGGTGQAAPAGRPAARGPGGGGRSIPVEVDSASLQKLSVDLSSVGTLQSDESISIAAEISGRITEILFSEGQPVAAGDPLVRLDDALLRAELADSEARLTLAQANFQRANSLSQSGTGTQRARDEAQSVLRTSQAALELARVRLSKTVIRAPFPGVAGLRMMSVGAIVQPGNTIANLEKIDVLKLDFRVPETVLAQVAVGQPVDAVVDAYPDQQFVGTLYAIDPQLDVNGRALRLRARLPNTEGLLRPGLFARVLLRAGQPRPVVVVPEAAIVPRGRDSFVFRVVDGKAVETAVVLGSRTPGFVEVISGVANGETVVVAGQGRLRNGTAVEVVRAATSVQG